MNFQLFSRSYRREGVSSGQGRTGGETYILDGTALKLIEKYRSECPDWFLKRLVLPA